MRHDGLRSQAPYASKFFEVTERNRNYICVEGGIRSFGLSLSLYLSHSFALSLSLLRSVSDLYLLFINLLMADIQMRFYYVYLKNECAFF